MKRTRFLSVVGLSPKALSWTSIYGKIYSKMAKKSILIFATTYLPLVGGAELALKNITDRLENINFDMVTGHYGGTSEERIGNVNVFRVGRNAMNSFFLPKALFPFASFLKGRVLLQKNRYDLVYVLQASQAGGAVWLLKKLGYISQPVIINIQEGKNLDGQSWLTRFFRRLILQSANHFVVISQYLKRYLINQGISENKISVIPNGVGLNNYQLPVSSYQLKEKLSISPQDKVIITVSRLVEKNGVADLIDAVHVLNAGSEFKNYKLIVVGGGPLEKSLRSKIKNLKLEQNVTMVGEVAPKELPSWLVRADIFVRPSLSEGLGTAFLEAMAAGLAIIGTPVGGIPDFLKDRETGLFCQPKNPKDIADKIMEIVKNQDLRQKLVKNGRKLVEEKYDWDIIAKKFENVYLSM